MIILNESQIKAWDAYTIKKGLSSLELVDQAATAVVQKLDLLLGEEDQEVFIVCGNGNNGADGLAIARKLLGLDYLVDVFVNLEGEHSEEWKQNYGRLLEIEDESLTIHDRWQPEEIELSSSGTIIDAMFGTGLSRPLSGRWLEITNWINDQSNLTISIDMPSGLYVDRRPDGEVVYADLVLTFQCQRLAFMMPESEPYYGEVLVCDIGLSDTFLLENDIRSFELQYYYLLPFLIERSRFSHKGDYGHGYLIAGSLGKGGASVLAATAAMRSGIGLLTVHIPKQLNLLLQISIPEAMVDLDPHDDFITRYSVPEKVTAIGIGPGIGLSEETRSGLIRFLIDKPPSPLVLDADALNALSLEPGSINLLPEGTIITPHPGEFDRLFGDQEDHFERFRTACTEAQKRKINIILKGGITIICQSNGVSFFNTHGNPGMATGGSGDVLTGILLGLLAQGYSPEFASLLGVYIHSTAGDVAAEMIGYEALIAGDIVDNLGEAFEQLRNEEPEIEEDDED